MKKNKEVYDLTELSISWFTDEQGNRRGAIYHKGQQVGRTCAKDPCVNNAYYPMILKWLEQPYNEPKSVLDNTENNYLKRLLKNFKKGSVTHIEKRATSNKCYSIVLHTKDTAPFALQPFNKTSDMYKNMKANKKYTLTKLGLE